jgi:RNA polymerase sigma-70 factor (ECF subfamily)
LRDGVTDAGVVGRVLSGDAEAFGLLVDRYQNEFTAYAKQMTGSLDEAADVVQESFVRAYRSLRSCREPARFKGWLFRIVSNQCKTHLSRRKRRRTKPLASLESLSVAAEDTSDEEAEAADLRRHLYRALEALTHEQREAVILKYLHGLSLEEMAGVLAATVPAIKMRLKRGREALRAELEDVML